MHKFAILAALLVFSFGFTSAFADDTFAESFDLSLFNPIFVNPDNLSFNHIPNSVLPRHVPLAIDPLT